ncbi:hypothetical protein D5S17_17480 [Pseudonocardiaceae bacterium YIM PH 21723]|nr:hypothetical protein D5S17_17480 [Pseudonocardiaceae bacterium YIM PH 21723]
MNQLARLHDRLTRALRSPSRPDHSRIASVMGAGLRTVLESFAQERALSGHVLVLTADRAQSQQWAQRLPRRGNTVVRLLSTTDALHILEQQPARADQILVSSYQTIAHGPGARVLDDLGFDLVVHDQPRVQDAGLVRSLAGKTAHSVVLHHLREQPAVPEWPLLFGLTREDIGGISAQLQIQECSYTAEPEERELRTAAWRVLSEMGRPTGQREIPQLVRALLGAISVSLPVEPWSQPHRIWELIDKFESLTVDESRLKALSETLRKEAAVRDRAVIVVDKVQDAHYIAQYLERCGFPVRSILSSRISDDVRRAEFSCLRAGETVVATAATCGAQDNWLPKTTLIWWPHQANAFMDRILDAANSTEGVKLVKFHEQDQS